VIILFQPFFAAIFLVFTTLNISSPTTPRILGKGTLNFAAFSALVKVSQQLPSQNVSRELHKDYGK
jgi:hypothetical protein